MEEKKESGIETLIELLNEFLEENYPKKNLVKAIEDDYFVNNWNDGDGFLCETIMSKKFGFIKRLVESDKIDFEHWEKVEEMGDFPIICFEYGPILYSDTDSIIMLLSIQDNPISFLISILK